MSLICISHNYFAISPPVSNLAFALGIHGVGERGVGPAPNRGAAGGVGDHQALSKQLRHQLHVRCLATTLTGAAWAGPQQRRGAWNPGQSEAE